MSEDLAVLAKDFVENVYIGKKKKKPKIQTQYKYLIVIDFEATCWERAIHKHKTQEIIEFPAVLLNLETGVIEKEFHHYVRPTENPILSEYCINLTGITQNMVEEAGGAILVEDCIREFVLWIKQTIREYSLILPKTKRSNIDGNVVLVSWSNWDFCICLTKECGRKKIRKPSFFNQFMDLKEIFMEKYKMKAKFNFTEALNHAGLEFVGQQHSGIADSRMTAVLAVKLHKDGANFRITRDLNQHELNRSF